MKLFVCEFITGGGLAGTALPDTLLREGSLMLHAVLTDLLQAGCQDILSTYDQRLEKPDFALACQPASVNVWEQWDALLQQADAALIIAPETAGALYRLCTLAEANHCDLLGCGSECIALTSSKRNTLAVLAEWGIRVPVVYDPDDPQLERSPAVIVKPDTGVGAEHVRKFACGGTLKQWLRAHDAEADWLVQEFIDGTPASMTLLCLADQCRVLAVNHQKIDFEQGLARFSGVEVNAFADLRTALTPLAEDIVQAIPGLHGFVGIDLVLTDRGPVTVEVNPRLTTAYAGLHTSLGYNPLQLLLNNNVLQPEPDAFTAKPVSIHI